MNRKISILLALFCAIFAHAQTNGFEVKRLELEGRLAWQGNWKDGKVNDEATGFRGQFINLRFDAQIVKGLDIQYRQRFTKPSDQNFWDATDFLRLNWQINPKWDVSAGKQIVLLGGREYDYAPIDTYQFSEFCNNIACYQLGVSAGFRPSKNDYLQLQFINSPLRQWAGNNSYAFNLYWSGQHGCWSPIWSFNLLEHQHRKWMTYFVLGNRFDFGPVHFHVDYMNRANAHQTFLFKDCSVMTEFGVQAHPALKVLARYTYDVNRTGTDVDKLVQDGTEIHAALLGIEAEPLKNFRDWCRIFGTVGYSWGKNTNPDGILLDKSLNVQVGVKFKANILDGIARLRKKHKD